MNEYNKHIVLLIKRLLLALFLFFAARLFFLVLNYSFFSQLSTFDLVYAFIIGMRFDLSVILYFNMLIVIMHIIPIGQIKNSKGYQVFIKYYFLIVNSLLLLINLGDARYFDFTKKRSTAYILDFLADSNDIPLLIPSFLVDYWYVSFTWLILTILTWFIYNRIRLKNNKNKTNQQHKIVSIIYQGIAFVILFGITAIGARGGLQNRPLSVIDAPKYSSAKSAPLVLNTPFAIMTTYGHKSFEAKVYGTIEECHEIYPTLHQYNYPDSAFRKVNVVILLLESFSKEYSGYLNNYKGYTPFLDSLMQQSLVLTNAFASGPRSIDAVPSIIAGIPPLMDDHLILSVYNTNEINSLARFLKDKGYYSAFFHGGNNGSMNFDAFAKMAGFDAYYGRTEYNNDLDYDDYWGIYDEPFLQYVANELNTFEEPFFAFEFMLSSHNPYRVPEKHKEKFPENNVKIHRVVQYSDYALKQFFKTVSAMPWFDNTLFVILADHTGHSITVRENNQKDEEYRLADYELKYYKNTAGRYSIPILFYFPGSDLIGKNELTTQQCDMLPSILDYLKFNKPFVAFGHSVFNDSLPRVAVEFVNGFYQITKGDYSLLFDGDQSVSLFNNRSDPEQLINLIHSETQVAEELETLIKAIVQQYHYRLLNNKLRP